MANLNRSTLACGFAALTAVAACEEPSTATGLHPEGPPMIQQVVMKEQTVNQATGSLTVASVLGFGTHDLVPEARTKPNTQEASPDQQTLRVVFDELLVGNALEEIACRSRTLSDTESCVVPGGFSRVPLGATPDDIADCAAADDLLDELCSGTHAVCLENGRPCGVADEDENGSADDSRMIAGQVRIICDGTDVPLNYELSFWQPAGNQLVPAGGTPEGSLGPALVLQPANDGLMPTNSDCQLAFAPDVTDKHGFAPCAPLGGDITQDCTPGDVSAFSFKTQRLRFSATVPEQGTAAVSRSPASVSVYFNTPIDPASAMAAGAITISPALPNMVVTVAANAKSLTASWCTSATPPCTPASFDAATEYTVTVDNLTDTFGKAMPQAETLTFTTAN
ncbi:MAG: Ig-like domain-containing protein [Deltaproteobacteria bacterium]|nr:Ig-like domain-containing protein [Kofleriaceae bacterium]